MSEVRDALRTLRGSPFVTMLALFSLALAIGANTAIFSLLNALMLRPLPTRLVPSWRATRVHPAEIVRLG